MHAKIALLMAIGQIASAFEGPGGNGPRAPPPDTTKPLATVTALENGHLPTCFTGHPTHPCPTTYADKRDAPRDLNDFVRKMPIEPISMSASPGAHQLPTQAPAIAKRQAPRKVDKDYIPQPNEWAIPQNFTFTDTISNKTNSSAASSDDTPPSPSGHADLRDAIAQKADAMINSVMRDLPSKPEMPTETGHSSGMPTAMPQEHIATNSSSAAHLTGTIGTLLSQAMFPGKMRPATTTSSTGDAAGHTPSLEAISMSQKPNTTMAEGTVQAFIHPINTDTPAAAEATASSSATEVAQHATKPTEAPTQHWDEAKFDKKMDEQLAAFDKQPSAIEERSAQAPDFDASNPRGSERGSARENSRENSRQWDDKKFDKELHEYLDAVHPEEASTTAKAVAEPSTLSTATRSTSHSYTVRSVTTTGPQQVHWKQSHPTSSAKSSSISTDAPGSASAAPTGARRNGRRFIS